MNDADGRRRRVSGDLASQHRQRHLEARGRVQAMGTVRRELQQFAGLHDVRRAADAHFGFAFEHGDESIERRRVLGESLSRVKREERDVAGGGLDQLFADDAALLVVDGVRHCFLHVPS